MNLRIVVFVLPMLSSLGRVVHAQRATAPTPVEFTAVNRYASFNLVMSKPLSANSRWGFFHLTTLVMDYDAEGDDLSMQSLLYFAPQARFRLTGGAFYGSRPGFSPTAGIQFVNAGRRWFVLLAPRVNLESEPSYTMFSILRYARPLNARRALYASLQSLNILDADGHIKSYQWTRMGLDIRGTQLGLAANFDESGPKPHPEFSLGAFVRRELF